MPDDRLASVIAGLAAVAPDLDASAIAEALWLAARRAAEPGEGAAASFRRGPGPDAHRPGRGATAHPAVPGGGRDAAPDEPADEPGSPRVADTAADADEGAGRRGEDDGDRRRPGIGGRARDGRAARRRDDARIRGMGGVPVSERIADGGVREPGVPIAVARNPALPDALAFGRALRPLRRPWPHGARTRLDTEATVHHYAHTSHLIPVFSPAPERRFDAVLIVDRAVSMAVWQPTIEALAKLMDGLGVFRSVRVCELAWDTDARPCLVDHLGRRLPLRRIHQQAGGPRSRRLVLVVSDCASKGWREPAIWRELRDTALKAPTALLDPLPPRLWPRTGLDLPVVRARTSVVGAQSTELEFRLPLALQTGAGSGAGEGWLPVPVMALSALSVSRWTRTLMRADPQGCDAVLIPAGGRPRLDPGAAVAHEDAGPAAGTDADATDAAVADAFLNTAPGSAVRLAVLASQFSNISISLLQLLRDYLVPEAQIADVAELVLSGLLVARPGHGRDPVLSFRETPREKLRSRLAVHDLRRTYQALTKHIATHPLVQGGIAALARTGAGTRQIPTELRPFAEATAETVRLLRKNAPPRPRRPDREQPREPEPQPSRTPEPAAEQSRRGVEEHMSPLDPRRTVRIWGTNHGRTRAAGTGYLVSPDTVLVPGHQVERLTSLTARLGGNDVGAFRQVGAGVVWFHPGIDVAVLRLDEPLRRRVAIEPPLFGRPLDPLALSVRRTSSRAVFSADGVLLGMFSASEQINWVVGWYRLLTDEEITTLAELIGLPPSRDELTRLPPSPATYAPDRLPERVELAGREAELAELEAIVAEDGPASIVVITGMPGVGKTAFAVEAVHRLSPRFPDGHVFVDFRSHAGDDVPYAPLDAAVMRVLAAAGIPEQALPDGPADRMTLYRNLLASTRKVFVFDDIPDESHIWRLFHVPGCTCLMLVTSREKMPMLRGARTLELRVLTRQQAEELVSGLTGSAASSDSGLRALVDECEGLPVALRALAEGLVPGAGFTAALEAAAARFAPSFERMPPNTAEFFTCVAAIPGPDFDIQAAINAADVELSAAQSILDRLVELNLAENTGPGRYRLHGLLRRYAASITEETIRASAVERVLHYYIENALRVDHLLFGTRPARYPRFTRRYDYNPARQRWSPLQDPVAWPRQEQATLLAAMEYAISQGDGLAALVLHDALSRYLRRYSPPDTAARFHESARRAARRIGDRFAEARVLVEWATSRAGAGDPESGLTLLAEALSRYEEIESPAGRALVFMNRGRILSGLGSHASAASDFEAAEAAYASHGDKSGQADALDSLADVRRLMRDYRGAEHAAARSLELYRSLGHRLGQADAYDSLGQTLLLASDVARAAEYAQSAARLYLRLGNKSGQAYALDTLSRALRRNGLLADAASLGEQALSLFRELGDRSGEAYTLDGLSRAFRVQGNAPGAVVAAEQALELFRELGDRAGEASALESLGRARMDHGDLLESGHANLSDAEELRDELGLDESALDIARREPKPIAWPASP